MIDLHGAQLTNRVVDDVIEPLGIELVSIETDMVGLAHLLRFFDGWLETPRFSASGVNPSTSTVATRGAHPTTGIGLIITSPKNHENSMEFIDDNRVVLETITNYI